MTVEVALTIPTLRDVALWRMVRESEADTAPGTHAYQSPDHIREIACETLAVEVERLRGFVSTADHVNALPDALRRYIHDLETRCDLAGEVRALTIARDTAHALSVRVTELETKLASLSDQCPTCSGTGTMRCVVRVEPPDEREVMENFECAECGGDGLSPLQRVTADRNRAEAILRDLRAWLGVAPPEPRDAEIRDNVLAWLDQREKEQ